jgi:hypothetical protein
MIYRTQRRIFAKPDLPRRNLFAKAGVNRGRRAEPVAGSAQCVPQVRGMGRRWREAGGDAGV